MADGPRTGIRPLLKDELDEADRIYRLAFGTHKKLEDPLSFGGDSDRVHVRWKMDPHAAFAAICDDRLIGTNFAVNWGGFGFFGPLTIHPEYWGRGFGGALVGRTMGKFLEWGVRQIGLYTFADSGKHLEFYNSFHFEPLGLTDILVVQPQDRRATWGPPDEKACMAITGGIFPGLDLSREIAAVRDQGIGETIAVDGAFAVCHCGVGSEAGSGRCFVKFAGARDADAFERILNACESFAASKELKLVAGMNRAREDAHRRMTERGFTPALTGLSMERPGSTGYNRPDVYAIDDWR